MEEENKPIHIAVENIDNFTVVLQKYSEFPKNPIVIFGFPGNASATVLYIIDTLADLMNAKKIATLLFSGLPSTVIVDDNGKIHSLQVSFRMARGKEGDILFVSGDKQPPSPEGINALAYYLSRVISMTEPKEILILGAAINPEINKTGSKPALYYSVSSSSKVGEIMEHIPNKDGMFLGMNAMISVFLEHVYNRHTTVVLVEVPPFIPISPESSLMMINEIDQRYNLELDQEKLKKRIEELKDTMKAFEQLLPKILMTPEKSEEEEEEEPRGYVA